MHGTSDVSGITSPGSVRDRISDEEGIEDLGYHVGNHALSGSKGLVSGYQKKY